MAGGTVEGVFKRSGSQHWIDLRKQNLLPRLKLIFHRTFLRKAPIQARFAAPIGAPTKLVRALQSAACRCVMVFATCGLLGFVVPDVYDDCNLTVDREARSFNMGISF